MNDFLYCRVFFVFAIYVIGLQMFELYRQYENLKEMFTEWIILHKCRSNMQENVVFK